MEIRVPQLVKVEPVTVSGIQIRTKNTDEFNIDTARIPKLWEQFFTEKLNEKIPYAKADSNIYGIYHEYESDSSGYYTVSAAVEITAESNNALLKTFEIGSGHYLVFDANGKIPAAIINAWKRIWDYFEKNTDYQRAFLTDFEVYKGSEECAIYIGIK